MTDGHMIYNNLRVFHAMKKTTNRILFSFSYVPGYACCGLRHAAAGNEYLHTKKK